PVLMSLNPTTAPISPAPIFSIGFCLLACIWKIREIRSLFPERVFNTYEPACSTPEYARIKHKRPTNGSVAILKPKAAKGSDSDGLREISSPLRGSVPLTASWSNGDGNNSITKSSMVCTPLFLKDEPH